MVDDHWYHKFKDHIWHINDHGYVYRIRYLGKRKKKILMHTTVLKSKKGYIVDHKDNNKLNNTEDNLRHITPAQNARNKRKYNGVSQYKGVTPTGDKWRAKIGFNYKTINIGIFEDELDAALAYDIWARKLDPEHFPTNFEENHPRLGIVAEMLNEEGLYRPAKRSTGNSQEDNKKYRGVKYLRDKDSYGAFIGYGGKRYKLGTRKLPSEAAVLYDTAARVLYRDQAVLNFPDKEEPVQKVVHKAEEILEEHGHSTPSRYKPLDIVSDDERPEPPKFRGVSRNGNKFHAKITYNGERIHISTRDTPEEAARDYDTKAIELLGRKAKTNFKYD